MPNWEKSFVGPDRKSGQGKGQLCGPVPESIRTNGWQLWPIGVGTYNKRPRATPDTDVSRGRSTIVTKSGTNDAGGGVKPVAGYLVNRLTLHWGSEVQVESHRCEASVSDGLAMVRRAAYAVSVRWGATPNEASTARWAFTGGAGCHLYQSRMKLRHTLCTRQSNIRRCCVFDAVLSYAMRIHDERTDWDLVCHQSIPRRLHECSGRSVHAVLT